MLTRKQTLRSALGDRQDQAQDALRCAGGPQRVISRERLVASALPVLVYTAVGEGSSDSKSKTKRLYNLRDALKYVDFADPASDSLPSMRNASRFLSSLFFYE